MSPIVLDGEELEHIVLGGQEISHLVLGGQEIHFPPAASGNRTTDDVITFTGPNTVTAAASAINFDAYFDALYGNISGHWRWDNTGSTSSSNTGPGTNNTAGYMHTETSGTAATLDALALNGVARMKQSVIPAGTSRILRLRLCIQGSFDSLAVAEGLAVRSIAGDYPDASVVAQDSTWTKLDDVLIRGWPYSNTYTVDSVLDTYGGGDDLTCIQNGGWADVDIPINDSATNVYLRPIYDSGSAWAHDIAIQHMRWSYIPV